MSLLSKRLLYWAPRVLAIAFIAFISLFSLDVFGENLGFWQTAGALAIHLIPSFVLIVILALAWRWEWIGTAAFAGAGLAYIVWLVRRSSVSVGMRVEWASFIAVPALVLAALFLIDWRKHNELHARS